MTGQTNAAWVAAANDPKTGWGGHWRAHPSRGSTQPVDTRAAYGLHGGGENCNRTIGLRLPGGVLFLCLNIPLRQTPCRNCQLSMWTMPTEGDQQ